MYDWCVIKVKSIDWDLDYIDLKSLEADGEELPGSFEIETCIGPDEIDSIDIDEYIENYVDDVYGYCYRGLVYEVWTDDQRIF